MGNTILHYRVNSWSIFFLVFNAGNYSVFLKAMVKNMNPAISTNIASIIQ